MVKGGLNIKNSNKEDESSTREIKGTFESECNNYQYEDAVKYMLDNHLDLDVQIKGLVDQRNPAITNKLSCIKHELTLTNDVKSSLEIAAKLATPLYTINASFVECVSVQNLITAEIEIYF